MGEVAMAGTLVLSEDLCWMPAGWIYDNALEGVAAIVCDEYSELQNRLLSSLTDANGGYLDLQSSAKEELQTILKAISTFIRKTVEAGPEGMHEASFYDGYVVQLGELEKLLGQQINQM